MTAIVTGASSGFGYEICGLLLGMGYTVYGISRRGTAPEGVRGIAADVAVKNEINAAVGEIAAREGRIDLLINNAGIGISGPLEFASDDNIRRIVDVNFIGALNCATAVIPYMRERKSGRIVFVSSVAAEIAIPYQAMYSATKAAVTSISLALRNELKEFGIRVCAVEPGDAQTGFTDAREKETAHEGVYTHSRAATASMERDERDGMTAEYVARCIVKAATAANPRPITVVGGKYRLFTWLFGILPKGLSYRIVGKMYG